jgi:hypothetical protein
MFQRHKRLALSGQPMARKCHRQKIATRFNLIGEQFWGRAARASWTRKSFQDALIFARFSSGSGCPTSRRVCEKWDSNVKPGCKTENGGTENEEI